MAVQGRGYWGFKIVLAIRITLNNYHIGRTLLALPIKYKSMAPVWPKVLAPPLLHGTGRLPYTLAVNCNVTFL